MENSSPDEPYEVYPRDAITSWHTAYGPCYVDYDPEEYYESFEAKREGFVVRFNPRAEVSVLPYQERKEARKARRGRYKPGPTHDELWDGDAFDFRPKELTPDEFRKWKKVRRVNSLPKTGRKLLLMLKPGMVEAARGSDGELLPLSPTRLSSAPSSDDDVSSVGSTSASASGSAPPLPRSRTSSYESKYSEDAVEAHPLPPARVVSPLSYSVSHPMDDSSDDEQEDGEANTTYQTRTHVFVDTKASPSASPLASPTSTMSSSAPKKRPSVSLSPLVERPPSTPSKSASKSAPKSATNLTPEPGTIVTTTTTTTTRTRRKRPSLKRQDTPNPVTSGWQTPKESSEINKNAGHTSKVETRSGPSTPGAPMSAVVPFASIAAAHVGTAAVLHFADGSGSLAELYAGLVFALAFAGAILSSALVLRRDSANGRR